MKTFIIACALLGLDPEGEMIPVVPTNLPRRATCLHIARRNLAPARGTGLRQKDDGGRDVGVWCFLKAIRVVLLLCEPAQFSAPRWPPHSRILLLGALVCSVQAAAPVGNPPYRRPPAHGLA